jgi:valyl-tRNA synthetase
VIVSKETPVSCAACGDENLEQDTDVLDTWFSSALWPFSTLGWPDSTAELGTFYPTSVLVTGFDILFFWVARMMMMGIHFMARVPFRDVYIHALVRDAEGQKMSKSKGNVIDPLEVMDQFGTDAFRFTLAALAAQGRDIKLSEDRIVGYRHFVNKIWNAARFTLMNVEGSTQGRVRKEIRTLPDRWILTRLGQISGEVCRALDEYRFNDAANSCYQFVWHELCDWYLELAKNTLYGEDSEQKEATRETVLEAMKGSLQLLHPFMPFVTEEIWQRLPEAEGSIMVSTFPEPDAFIQDEKSVTDMESLMGVVHGIRNIRGEMNIPPSKNVSVVIDVAERGAREVLEAHLDHIRTLGKVEEVTIGSNVPKPEASATAVFGKNQVHVLLRGILDFREEKKRLGKAIEKLEKDIHVASKKLANQAFLDKAPADVVAEVKEKMENLSVKLEKLHQNLSFFENIRD